MLKETVVQGKADGGKAAEAAGGSKSDAKLPYKQTLAEVEAFNAAVAAKRNEALD